MEGQFVTVCVLCLLCAGHVHCSAHGPDLSSQIHGVIEDDGGGDGGGASAIESHNGIQRNETPLAKYSPLEPDFISHVFEKFGDGESLSKEGFESLLRTINLDRLISNETSPYQHKNNSGYQNHAGSLTTMQGQKTESSTMCVTSRLLFGKESAMSKEWYRSICPVLLYQLLPNSDVDAECHSNHKRDKPKDMYSVWMYATLSIIVISLCGLGGVVVIPVMQQVFYHHLLQFLVALAVGTLCGDALLHLLPHAMLPTHSHSHSHSRWAIAEVDNHDTNMWRGLVAMLGIIFFYITEKCLSVMAAFRKRKQRKNQNAKSAVPRVRVMRDTEVSLKPFEAVGEKLCKHKYSSYPYCYGEITDNTDNRHQNGSADGVSKPREENGVPVLKVQKFPTDGVELEEDQLETNKDLDGEQLTADSLAAEESYTVIIREHETVHHGHSHQHGHVHAAPTSLSSVAWMVVLGDGLHNFADGVSIGAAFASNIAGGFSTALAVFMHELPHELGDFAVLLQAGMSAKQAVFYNLLSSILCFVGMCLGVWLGHNEETTQWVFSAAAGMFLYIALVDMIPELTSNHSETGSLCQCLLHFAGLMSGVCIMLVIALYERDLKSVFKD